MKIYLDIDGTIINKTTFSPANHLKKFLKYMTDNHDVYWLTTHCKGDPTYTLNHIKQFVSADILTLLKKVKPTNWSDLKTEAIDLTEDFIWFDDYIMHAEGKELERHNKINSHVKVDLDSNPDIFLEYIENNAMVCKAYIIDILRKSYMLHIWFKPYFGIGWHKKIDGPNKRILGIYKY